MSKRRCGYCGKYKNSLEMVIVPISAFCDSNHMYLYANEHTDKLIKKSNKLVKQHHAKEKRTFHDNDRPKRLKAAQKAFNAYIRKRDDGKPCISCDRTILEIEKNDGWKVGGCWDCGHFLAVGAFPELRFEPLNAHRQCKSCNGGSGKYTKKNHTVGKEYELKLIKKIGLNKVNWLKGPHKKLKLSAMDLKDIEDKYKNKLKDML